MLNKSNLLMLVVLLFLLITGGLYYSSNGSETNDDTMNIINSETLKKPKQKIKAPAIIQMKSPIVLDFDAKKTFIVETSNPIKIDQEKIDQVEKQVAANIKQYSENLNDPEVKQKLEKETSELTQSYKKEVLKKVKQANEELKNNK